MVIAMANCKICKKEFKLGDRVVMIIRSDIEGFDYDGSPELKSHDDKYTEWYHDNCWTEYTRPLPLLDKSRLCFNH